MSWRDHLKVHPAADLFPLMSESELRELSEDIKANGLQNTITLCKYNNELAVLDGRNRLDAMELAGMKTGSDDVEIFRACKTDPYDFVLSANINRRHLTDEQRRGLIAKVIKAKPEASDRAIAKQVKRDHKTVAKVRKKMESTGEVSPVEKRVGADGKERKARAPKPLDKLFNGAATGRVTESAEVSIEDRKAEMARLDDEVDKRVSCLANTIRGHVDGLPHSDVKRFFATLRDCVDVIELALRADAGRQALQDAEVMA